MSPRPSPSSRRLIAVVFACAGLIACSSDTETSQTSATGTTVVSAITGADPNPTTALAPSTTATTVDAAQVEAIVEFTVTKGESEGFAFDRECVRGIVRQLSVDDLEALYVPTLDSVPGAVYPSLSGEGAAKAEEMTTCLLPQGGDPALIEQVSTLLLNSGEGPNLDEECVRTQVATLNDVQLRAVIDAQVNSSDPELAKALGVVRICLVELSG